MSVVSKVEDLLKPRYKVIADYPNSKENVGFVIELPSEHWRFGDANESYCEADYFDAYPAIFRKLEWWEEREESELPEYVKSLINQKYYMVINRNAYSFRASCPNELNIDYPWGNVLPATVEEYEQYKNQSNGS